MVEDNYLMKLRYFLFFFFLCLLTSLPLIFSVLDPVQLSLEADIVQQEPEPSIPSQELTVVNNKDRQPTRIVLTPKMSTEQQQVDPSASDFSSSTKPCSLRSISLDQDVVDTQGTVSLLIESENCEQRTIVLTIHERDSLLDDLVDTLRISITSQETVTSYTLHDLQSFFEEPLEGEDLELYFKVNLEEDISTQDKLSGFVIRRLFGNQQPPLLFDTSFRSPALRVTSRDTPDDSSGSGLTPTINNVFNFITITEKSHQTIPNYPVQIARPFIEGEILNYPQAVLNNVPLQTQADVKQRWSDGSVKHAILTFYIPLLQADSSLQIFFQNQPNGNNNGYLTPQNMLLPQYNFDAIMELTNSSQLRSVSARDMLIAGDFTYWMQGTIATSIILADHSALRRYDKGFNQYNPFRPLFHATFFPLINKIRVRYIGEAANTEELGEFSYNLVLKLGLSPQTLVYTKNAFTQNSASRWTKEFWIGGAPSAVNIDHNLPYLIQTSFIPNYDTSKVIPESKISSDYSRWVGTQKDIGNSAFYLIDMSSTGGRPEIGPYPDWVVQWLYTGDYRSKEISSGLADLAGAWPVQFREARQGTYFLRGSTAVPALGKVISITARPNVQGRFLNSEGFDAVTYVGPATSSWVPDGAHQPDPYSVLYTLTGDYWYLEQMYFWSSWSAAKGAAGNANELRLSYFRGPTGEFGGINDQIRGLAWVFRSRAQTAFLAPDTDAEKTYFTTLANDAIALWEGQRNIPCSTCANYADNTRLWNWANTIGMGRWIQNGAGVTNNLGIPPLHHWMAFNNAISPSPTNSIDETITTSVSATWEENMLLYALGRGKELGFPTDALLTWSAPYLIGQLTDPSYDPYLTTAYMTPTAKQVSGQWYSNWFTTWAEVKNGFKSWYHDPQDPRSARHYFDNNSLQDTGHGYAYMIIAGLSMITDKPGGTAAWNLANQLILTAPNNPLALLRQNENPKWLILPHNLSSGSSPLDYRLSITPATQTVQQGQTTQPYTLTATAFSGTPEEVVFTAPNLPQGVTAQFTPTSCTPTLTQPCTSNMVLQTSSTTPAQSYSLSVTGRSVLTTILRQVPYDLIIQQMGNQQLGENQVFVRNDNTFPLVNHLVSIPISFQPCEYREGDNNIRLQDTTTSTILTTQIQTTGYYQKDSSCPKGSVMFAVAYVQVSLAPGEERIYNIIRSTANPGSFVYASEVQDFLTNGQLKSVSTDVFGRDYVADIPFAGLEWVVNGSVVKIAKYEKMNDQKSGPVCSTGQPCLEYLFSTVVYLTFVSNEPLVRAQVFVVNAPNLQELTPANVACQERNSRGNCVYRRLTDNQPIWSIGDVKYNSLRFEIVGNQHPLSYYFPNIGIRRPTRITQVDTVRTTIWTMPTDGQEIIGALGSPNGNSFPGVKNYLAEAQGLLVEGTINFNRFLNAPYGSHDYFVENNIAKGQSGKRFGRVERVTEQLLPDASKLGDSSRWYSAADALESKNIWRASRPELQTHFGNHPIYQTILSEPSAGYPVDPRLETESPFRIKYMFSCMTRCEDDYLNALRYKNIQTPMIVNHLVGHNPWEHSQANPIFSSLYYFTANVGAERLCDPDTPRMGYPDSLTLCNPSAPTAHRYDYPGPASHEWGSYTDTHWGSAEGELIFLTGDLMLRKIFMDTSNLMMNAAHNADDPSLLNTVYGAVRSAGRRAYGFTKTAQMVNPSTNNFYIEAIERWVLRWEDRQNQDAPGSRGVNPITGRNFPTGFLDEVRGDGRDPLTPNVRGDQAWIESIAASGLIYAREEILQTPAVVQTADRILDRLAYYLFNYAYRDPSDVRNGVTVRHAETGQDVLLNEGFGYTTKSIVHGPQPGLIVDMYEKFDLSDSTYHFNANSFCLLSKYVDSSPIYKSWAKKAFEAKYFTYLETYNAEADIQYQRSILGRNINGYFLCGMTYLEQLPTVSSTTTCTDNDQDGYPSCSTVQWDCDDNNPNIHPNAREDHDFNRCTDRVDNNCNGLIDCEDAMCQRPDYGNQNICSGTTFCGDLLVQTPNAAGLQENCDINTFTSTTRTNSCSQGKCIAAYVPPNHGNRCTCSAPAICGDNTVNQQSEECDGSDRGICGPSISCSTQCLCNGPVLNNLNPNNITNPTQNVLVAASGRGFTATPTVKVNGVVQPSITVSFVNQSSVSLTFTPALVQTLNTGTHQVSIVNANGQETRSLPLTLTVSGGGTQTPTIASVQPATFSAVTPVSITVFGQNFANDAEVLVDTLPISSARITSRSTTQIVFSYQPRDYRVGQHALAIRNPTAGRTSNSMSFRLTATPTITRLNPSTILNNVVINTLDIEGQELDPLAVVIGGQVYEGPWTSSTYQLVRMTNIQPGIAPGDYSVVVVNNDLRPSNNLILQVRQPFTFTLNTQPRTATVTPNSQLPVTFTMAGVAFSTPESILINATPPADITVSYPSGPRCTPSTTAPYHCTVLMNIQIGAVTVPQQYTLDIQATSSSAARQDRIMLNATQGQLSDCTNGRLDSHETDIDCGGTICSTAPSPGPYLCDYTRLCQLNRDCRINTGCVLAGQPTGLCTSTAFNTLPTVCQPDTDCDTVPDGRDRCSQTAAGITVSQRNGCPLPRVTRFSLNITTDFTQQEDFERIPDLSLGIIGVGRVQYIGQEVSVLRLNANVSQALDIDALLTLEQNNIGFDSAAYPELNKQATLTFNGLNYSSAPTPLRDGQVCSIAVCASTNYTNGDYVALVPGFSNYSTQEGTCGDTYCNLDEDCTSCSQDCGSCGGGGPGGSGGGGGGGGGGGDGQRIVVDLDTNIQQTVSLFKGSRFTIKYQQGEYGARIPKATTDDVVLTTSAGSYTIFTGQKMGIDLNDDSRSDVNVAYIGLHGNTATLTFSRIIKERLPTFKETGEQASQILDQEEQEEQKEEQRLTLPSRSFFATTGFRVSLVLLVLLLSFYIRYRIR